MFAFQDFKNVNKRTRYAVYGWIRKLQSKLKFCNIPSVITASCILYCRDHEIFDIIGYEAKLSKNKKIITKNNYGISDLNAQFGLNQIDSSTDHVYTWKLLIKQDILQQISIGICSNIMATTNMSNKNMHNLDYRAPKGGIWFLFRGGHRASRNNRYTEDNIQQYKAGDIVSLCLDLKQAGLGLIINGIKQDAIFSNIPKDKQIKYRLVVSLFCPGDSVEILDFMIQ